jgi:hypothetical protein
MIFSSGSPRKRFSETWPVGKAARAALVSLNLDCLGRGAPTTVEKIQILPGSPMRLVAGALPRRWILSNLGLTAEPTIVPRGLLGFSRKASPWDSEQPIREELFSVERLEAHAKSLAVAQAVASRPSRGLPLSARLADNSAVLLSAFESIVKAIDDARQITPAGEWLIDNFHLVETQIRQISTDLEAACASNYIQPRRSP